MPDEYKTFHNITSTSSSTDNNNNKPTTSQTTKVTSAKSVAYRPTDAVVEEDPEVKAENKRKFMEMMRECGIKADFTWEMAMGKIIDDPRYQLLRLLADRKAAFFEFIQLLQTEEAEKIQQDQGKARENFMELLQEHTELDWNSSFRKFSQTVENDLRWSALQSDIERECLFEEHLLGLKRAARVRINYDKAIFIGQI